MATLRKGLELIRRHFWAWLGLTNTALLSHSKYLVGEILEPEIPILLDPLSII